MELGGESKRRRDRPDQMVQGQRTPLSSGYPKPNRESRESLEETEKLLVSEHPGYDSLEDMFESMGR